MADKKYITVLYQFSSDDEYNKFIDDFKRSNESGHDNKTLAISLSNKFKKAEIFQDALERISHECTGDLVDDDGNEQDIFEFIEQIFKEALNPDFNYFN
jgi:hypothetical protein